MSNLIKYQFVNLDGKDKFVINNNSKQQGDLIPLGKSAIKIQTVGEIEAEKALKRARGENDTDDGKGEFKAGLQVSNFDKIFEEQESKSKEKAEKIVEQARLEAQQILDESEEAVKMAKNRAYDEGKNQGYEDGIAQAQDAIHKKEEELIESERIQKQEIADYISSVEKRYTDIVISLIRKITGVVIEDKQDLVLYLIKTAAMDLEPSENYKIRISSEDIFYLESHKEELLEQLGQNVNVDFVEEKGLEKGQCIIETDNQMIDCGLQTQLDMLVQNLKMLVH